MAVSPIPLSGASAEPDGVAAGADPWRSALAVLAAQARRHAWLIALAALAAGLLAGAARELLPASFKSTAQVLIDPRGFRLFANDLSAGSFEANAAITFVESQMGVIKSERVLLRVVRDERLAGETAAKAASPGAPDVAESLALAALQRSLSVQRQERSFLVDVAVTDLSAERAARLANAVVKAYVAEDTVDRNAAAAKLTAELAARLDGLRKSLRDSEAKVEDFRRERGLSGLGDRPVIERKLPESIIALGAAEGREAQARARLKQLAAGPAGLSNLGALGADPDSRKLALLIEAQTSARADLDKLSGELGPSHPALLNARNRVRELDKNIAEAIGGVRRAARLQLEQAQAETALLNRNVAAVSADYSKARQSETELRSLEAVADGNRKILESFETRAREVNEFGKIDGANLRIVTPARQPNVQSRLLSTVLWAASGLVAGALAMLGALGLLALLRRGPAPQAAAGPAARDDGEAWAPPPLRAERLSVFGRAQPSAAAEDAPPAPMGATVQELLAACAAPPGGRAGAPVNVLVTSARAGCGKSPLALNLARAAAEAGRRTLLIDANPANPALPSLVEPGARASWMRLDGVSRPLYRLGGAKSRLSVLALFSNASPLDAEAGRAGGYELILGVDGNFDFAVFDGPSADNEAVARDIARTADWIILVADIDDPEEPTSGEMLEWLHAPPTKLAGVASAWPPARAAA